jgi:uncharacterized protein
MKTSALSRSHSASQCGLKTEKESGSIKRWLPVLSIAFLPVLLVYGLSYLLVISFRLTSDTFLNLFSYLVVGIYLILALIVATVVKKEGESLSSIFNFRLGKIPRDIAIGFGLVLVLVLLKEIYFSVWTRVLPVPNTTYFGTEPPPLFWILIVLPAVAAIVEEFVWRGYVITRVLALTNSQVKSLLISSIGFGIWHHTAYDFGLEFFVGLALGIVYLKTKTLLPVIVGHCVFDSFAFLTLLS